MATEPAAERDLRGMLRSTLGALHGSARRGDRGLVMRAEDIVRADRTTRSTSTHRVLRRPRAAAASWSTGRFETPSIGASQDQLARAMGSARLGYSPETVSGEPLTASRPSDTPR
jgi:hypothetical protein